MAYNYFHKRGYRVKVYYASFSHSLKKNRLITGKNFHPIQIRPYAKNISIERFFSHYEFAHKTGKLLKNESPDIVYFNLPPNLLGIPLCRLRKRNKYLLIVDVLDIWPETFPFTGFIKWAFNSTIGLLIKQTREYVLNNVDMIITESEYFSQKMKLYRFNFAEVIYLKKINSINISPSIDTSTEISISYIGNIGNIYDFKSLLLILNEVKKERPISIDIIGEGDLKYWLLDKLRHFGITYKFYGATFDEKIKKQVITRSWFGYNGFKNNTEVALSYKTIEYFSFGTPIINSAKGDTYNIAEEYSVGINFSSSNIDKLVSELVNITKKDILYYKKNVIDIFENKFSNASYFKEMDVLLEKLIHD